MKVLIITGGDSSEREVSLNSAENVKNELKKNGHDVYVYDLKRGHDGLRKIVNSYDVLFPVLHGEEGEGGILHKYLVGLGKPIVGTRNYKGLRDAWYKLPFKEYCDANGVNTSPWRKVSNREDVINFGFPCVLKASNGGSSREVVLLHDDFDLETDEAKNLLKTGKGLYVEKLISGPEITVGVLEDKALPVLEIVPPTGSWFNYKNKYSPETKEIPFAPSVPASLQEKAQQIALKIHRDFNLGTYSRTDFMTTKDDVYALEINTIPGLTAESLMPKAAKAIGMNFGQFLEVLLRDAR